MNILIADDHAVVRSGLRQIIESHPGMSVVAEAMDAEQALDLARRLCWHVAVVDYEMPGKSGVHLIKEIKRCHPARPVLVLSWHAEDLLGVEVVKAGASGYLNKDSCADELVHAIHKVAGGGKYISPSLADRLADELVQVTGFPQTALSHRERQVMGLLAAGRQVKEIGEELSISPNTVSTFRVRIFRKLGFRRNADLVRYAIAHSVGP